LPKLAHPASRNKETKTQILRSRKHGARSDGIVILLDGEELGWA
jgi:hypothetical protein